MELGDILAVLEAYQNNPLVNNPSKESFRETRRLLKKYRVITKIIDKWLKDPDDRFSEDYLTDIYDVIKDSENHDSKMDYQQEEEKRIFESNVKAILECNFAGFKDEIIENACKLICNLKINDDRQKEDN